MNSTLRGKVSEVLTKYNFSPEDAQFLTDVLQEIDDRQRSEFEAKLDQLLTQKDKTELTILMQRDKVELIDRIEQNKVELIDRIEQNKAELTNRIEQNKAELIDRIQKVETSLSDRIQRVETSLTRQVYIVGLIQFLAIVGALIGIINFALK